MFQFYPHHSLSTISSLSLKDYSPPDFIFPLLCAEYFAADAAAFLTARLCHEPYPCLSLISCSNKTLFVSLRRRAAAEPLCLRSVCARGFDARGERTLPSVSDKWSASPPNKANTCKWEALLVRRSSCSVKAQCKLDIKERFSKCGPCVGEL